MGPSKVLLGLTPWWVPNPDRRKRCFVMTTVPTVVTITTDVEKQGYWQSIEALHNEYDSWHVLGDARARPPRARAGREPW